MLTRTAKYRSTKNKRRSGQCFRGQSLAYRTQMGCTHLRFSLMPGSKDLHVIVIRAGRKWMESGWGVDDSGDTFTIV